MWRLYASKALLQKWVRGSGNEGAARFAEFFDRCFLDLKLVIKNLKKKEKQHPREPSHKHANTAFIFLLCRLSHLKIHLHSLQMRC